MLKNKNTFRSQKKNIIPVLLIIFFSIFFIFYKYLNRPLIQALIPLQQHTTISFQRKVNPLFFYGVNVEMSQLLPGSKNYVVNNKDEDLIDMASKLGINLFRITNSTGIDDKNTTVYTKQQWDTVLNKMQAKHIKALILIESPTIYQKYISSDYQTFMNKYIINKDVLGNPDIYGVDLYNEPVLNNKNLDELKGAAVSIKKVNPNLKITVGWWARDTFKTTQKGKEIYVWDDYAAGKQLENIVDFYSIHIYGFDQPILGIYPDPYLLTKNFIQKVESSLQTNKPILIEEFGAANGETLSDQDTIGSPQIQANAYQGVYQALNDMHDKQIVGAVAFQFISRTRKPDAWAIIKNNGDYLFPAAYVLQKYATSY